MGLIAFLARSVLYSLGVAIDVLILFFALRATRGLPRGRTIDALDSVGEPVVAAVLHRAEQIWQRWSRRPLRSGVKLFACVLLLSLLRFAIGCLLTWRVYP